MGQPRARAMPSRARGEGALGSGGCRGLPVLSEPVPAEGACPRPPALLVLCPDLSLPCGPILKSGIRGHGDSNSRKKKKSWQFKSIACAGTSLFPQRTSFVSHFGPLTRDKFTSDGGARPTSAPRFREESAFSLYS